MLPEKTSSIKVGIYIDGYNLYYGRLRGTAYKWLNVVQLFENILKQRDQNEIVGSVTLFTAHALANFATHGRASVEAQSSYLRALKNLHPNRFDVVFGKHTYDSSGTLLPIFTVGQPYDRTSRVKVWKLEEKKTDVNLALTMYRDAAKTRFDRMILVSNDSDTEPALHAIRQDFPNIMLGVVMPLQPPAGGKATHRRISGSLANIADWTVNSISDKMLADAQLPEKVATKKKPIIKPIYW